MSTWRTIGTLVARHPSGALVRSVVGVQFFVKSSGAGTVYHDNEGSYRWITVHPGNSEEKGVPVKIRESKTEPGTWHVVAGAGGKLNYLRLTGVKSPEEYRAQTAAKRQERTAREKHRREAEKTRKAELSGEEKAAEKEQRETAKAELTARTNELDEARRSTIETVAKELGWDEWDFDRERLERAAVPAKRIETLERAHWRTMWARVRTVLGMSTRELLADPQRAQEVLGDLPPVSEWGDTPALTDMLDQPKTPTGTGVRQETGKRSDEAILAQAAQADADHLAALAAETRRNLEHLVQLGVASPADHGALRDLEEQTRMARLVAEAATLTPDELAAEERKAATRVEEVQAERAKLEEQLGPILNKIAEARKENAPTELSDDERATLERARELGSDLQSARRRHEDVAVMAGGTVKPAIEGEQAVVRGRTREERLTEIAAAARLEGQDPAAAQATYLARIEMMQAGAARYRAEVRQYNDRGVVRKPTIEAKPLSDPKAVIALAAQAKKIERLEREITQASKAVESGVQDDLRIFGKGKFTRVDALRGTDLEQTRQEYEGKVHEAATRAFLTRAEHPELLLGRGGRFTEQYDPAALHRAMERHLSAGAYNVLNNAALATAKTPVLSREAVDVLGAAGAAELLAWALHQSESRATLREFSKSLGEYHVRENVAQAEERLRELDEDLDAADEAVATMRAPEDIAAAKEASQKRLEALERAREVMGTALGEYEATAALVAALGAKAPNEVSTNLGPIGSDAAIRQLRGLGLERNDYELTSDGVNHFATVRESGFAKLVQRPDPAHVQLHDDVMAIKRGEQDEDDWRPLGTVVRTSTTLNGEARYAASPLATDRTPFEQYGSTPRALADEIKLHAGQRLLDGEDIHNIIPDLVQGATRVPEAHRKDYLRALNELLPAREPIVKDGQPVYVTHATTGDVMRDPEGNPIPAMQPVAHRDPKQLEQLMAVAAGAAGLDSQKVGIHNQGVDVHHEDTHEATFRALAADPRRMVAFKPPAELTSQDQQALRSYFGTEAERRDAGKVEAREQVKRELATLGPEPERYETGGLFGDQVESEAWRGWHATRARILEEAHTMGAGSASTSWGDYVRILGGTANAYGALQERLKGEFARDFHQHYTAMTGQPLAIGLTTFDRGYLHAGYLHPERRRQAQAQARQERAGVQGRDLGGRYGEGTIAERLQELRARQQTERENQVALLGGTPAATRKREPEDSQRHTLGRRLEAQIASLMPNVAQHFRPGEPVKLLGDKSYSGRFVHQQRVIKQFLRTKRLVNATGTGSGKTAMMIGALTHARESPEHDVQRGLFLVPSAVQGQFGGEFARFADPTKLRWHANPGGDRAQRLGEHADAEVGAVVHTHQAYRDDMLHLLGQQWGTAEAATKQRFMALDRKGAAAALRETWGKHGIDYQMVSVDEGHQTLDRAGKADSFLSRVVQATTDNAAYYHSASADPIKNDISELRSLLDKLHPDGRYSDVGAWQRRYGVNTTAAAEAIKREVAPWIYAAHIKSGNQVNRRTETVPLHPEQERQYAAVMTAFQAMRNARGRGDIKAATEAARELLGTDLPDDPKEAEAVARQLMRHAGAAKEQALARIIDAAPPEQNAKIQKLREMLKDHPVRDKPVVIFAHRLAAVDHLTEALAADGHRVEQLTGADSAAERDRKRRRFQPDTGDPQADVFVLSDAGEAGLNLQRGQTLVQYDRPMTAKTWHQRNGRIDRLGQEHPEVDLIDLTTDSPFEARAATRIREKNTLRDVVTDPAGEIDDHGLAQLFAEARKRAVLAPAAPPADVTAEAMVHRREGLAA